ncbi:MAG: hypothetical protein V1702_05050 [Candidatus Woesearchaeota archaeon]
MTENAKTISIGGLPADLSIIDSPNFLIFIHGVASDKNSPRMVAAGKAVSEAGIASTLRYSSSRNWSQYNPSQHPRVKALAFGNKTFQEQLHELDTVVEYAIAEFHPERIFLSGHSYGGALAIMETWQKPIAKALLSSPQVHLTEKWYSRPLYRGFPSADIFSAILQRCECPLYIIHGDNDLDVPIEQSEWITKQAKNSVLERIAGADHSYSGKTQEWVRHHIAAFQ